MSSGKHKRHFRTDAQNRYHYSQTAKHKIAHIEKSLKTAGGQAIAKLQERLAYWAGQK